MDLGVQKLMEIGMVSLRRVGKSWRRECETERDCEMRSKALEFISFIRFQSNLILLELIPPVRRFQRAAWPDSDTPVRAPNTNWSSSSIFSKFIRFIGLSSYIYRL
jgi:hypothetical protein